MADDRIGVADFIQRLRADLEAATAEGNEKDLRFEVEDLEVELQVVATAGGEGKVGGKGTTKLWIFNGEGSAEAKGSYARSRIQTVRLKLKATEKNETGGSRRARLKGRLG